MMKRIRQRRILFFTENIKNAHHKSVTMNLTERVVSVPKRICVSVKEVGE